MFSTLLENFLPYMLNLKLSSAYYLILEESKISCLGKGEFPEDTFDPSVLKRKQVLWDNIIKICFALLQDVVTILLQYGADIGVINAEGHTAKDVTKNGDIIKLIEGRK